MLGAIIGDIVGSIYEFNNIKQKEFKLFDPKAHFTDDTVLTIALMDAILRGADYGRVLHWYYLQYPNASYGSYFRQWAAKQSEQPYGSWGNGSAMRTSPVAYACKTLDEVLTMSKRFASYTHNHPEGIKGAQATSAAIFLALQGESKKVIKNYITKKFNYDLDRKLDNIRPTYRFEESCQGTVPEAIIAFIESTDYEDAIRNAISLGGDSDTLACITGGIAEAFYGGVPRNIVNNSLKYLDNNQTKSIFSFYYKYSFQPSF